MAQEGVENDKKNNGPNRLKKFKGFKLADAQNLQSVLDRLRSKIRPREPLGVAVPLGTTRAESCLTKTGRPPLPGRE